MVYFSFREFAASETASRENICNDIPESLKRNISALVDNVLDPTRKFVNQKIFISSGYRSPRLNLRVGGVAGSQHVRGEASDLQFMSKKARTMAIGFIIDNCCFDQLIVYPTFIHVSYSRFRNRRMIFYKH